MADPLSVTASLAAVATAAIQSAKALATTVQRYRDRDKTLRRLQDQLEDLASILETLKEATAVQTDILPLLEGPISRCSQICHEFEKCMRAFHGKSKTGLRDWTKLEFMMGNINDFMDTLSGYKSTIAIALGTVTMRASTLSQQLLKEYSEMIQDTMYSHNIQLQRIDERVACITQTTTNSETRLDLTSEKVVVQQCIRICEDASSYIDKLATHKAVDTTSSTDSNAQFESQMLTRKLLNDNRQRCLETLASLQIRLGTLISDDTSESTSDRNRIQEDLAMARQCLEVCNLASSEVDKYKVYRIGEAIAEGNSDQVVVNTWADLFDVKKALSKDDSAQLVASMTDETLQMMSRDRYGSRFGAITTVDGGSNHVSHTARAIITSSKEHKQKEPIEKPVQRKTWPNEVRKRASE